MKAIALGLSLLFLLVSDSQDRGLSYIGMCHKSVKKEQVREAFEGRDVLNIHFLSNTFNANGCPAFEELAKDPRPMILHVSLINGPGLRNRRLQKHEYFYGYTIWTASASIRKRDPKALREIDRAIKDAKEIIALRQDRVTLLRIKPVLESDFGAATTKIIYRRVQKQFPKIELIDNPHKSKCIDEFLCETHGRNTTGDIVDLDGISAKDVDLVKWTKKTEGKVGRFYWINCNNGLTPTEKWIPPLRRTNWCSIKELNEANAWMLGRI